MYFSGSGLLHTSLHIPPIIFTDNIVDTDDPSTVWVVVSIPHPYCKLN